ncbi:MAG: outer membrane lipoprotein-sorting protein [Hydrogenophilaceae bacterium]
MKPAKQLIRRLSLVSLCLMIVAPAMAALTSHEILRTADRSRGNVDGIIWKLGIGAKEKGELSTMNFNVSARGFDMLAETLDPPKHKGNKLLMIHGNMWFYKPGLSKPVPISKRQRLLGNAAYGDIASTNYADDYEAIALPDDKYKGEDCYVYDLKSINKSATYDRIKYWVSKQRLVGVHAEYATVSGKKFKSADMEYGNKVKYDGEMRPFISGISIYDELMSADVTMLDFGPPKLRSLPDHLFNLNLFMK